MIYLCSVYSLNADEALMQKRYEYALKRTAGFMRNEYTIFCPIVHCHNLAELPNTWDFWETHDLDYLDSSEEVWVLMMPGWMMSTGVTAEIAHAEAIGTPVYYIPCDDYDETIEEQVYD